MNVDFEFPLVLIPEPRPFASRSEGKKGCENGSTQNGVVLAGWSEN